ncbi:MAG TPA: hypothetical protein VEC36_10910 [Patescibacteria group bacterium]|nr:hypothetical protein [Patescibacteria group bacterium]
MNYLKKILLLLPILASCATPRCPDIPAVGNLGQVINSHEDEFSPVVFKNGQFYFTSTRDVKGFKKGSESVFSAAFQNNRFGGTQLERSMPLNLLENSGAPAFFYNTEENFTELYYAGITNDDPRSNVQIFRSVLKKNSWSRPEALDSNINSPNWDSQPAISPDGTFMVFASDREGGLGGADLYISFKNNGTWTKAVNLGDEINTAKDERTPMISTDGTLFFASRGYGENGSFEILKAERISPNSWGAPKLLPPPLNSEGDDISPFTWGDSIFVASNREGGCGGYDIYGFQLCGPVLVRGSFAAPEFPIRLAGSVAVTDEDGVLLKTFPVDESGSFSGSLPAQKSLTLRYTSDCLDDLKIEQFLKTPCSVESSVALVSVLKIPANYGLFTFEKYDVPFFVTGYHLPNTTENLEALRLKFEYNLLGTNDSTRYIHKPTDEYVGYARQVDEAITDAAQFIIKRLEYFESACAQGTEQLEITVEGFADPRQFTELARYAGETINDPASGVNVTRGTPMSNELLSQLRAYSTSKSLEAKLRGNDSYERFKNRILWTARGRGVDTNGATPDEIKRRVSLKMGLKTM